MRQCQNEALSLKAVMSRLGATPNKRAVSATELRWTFRNAHRQSSNTKLF